MTACRTAIAAISICLSCLLFQCIAVSFRVLFTIFKEGVGTVHDFRITPHCKWDTRSFGILHIVELYFLTAVSGHPIGPIFRGPTVLFVPKRRKETTDLYHVKSHEEHRFVGIGTVACRLVDTCYVSCVVH